MPPLILAAIPVLKGLPWRAIGIAVVAAGLFLGGWSANGWRWSARWAERETAIADARTKASEEAREREKVLADAIVMIDAEHTAERTKADAENADLRAAVAAGSKRLFVNVACPAAGLPQAAAGTGLGAGTRAELDPDARPDYHALREGLMRQESKLAECQDVLRAERRAP